MFKLIGVLAQLIAENYLLGRSLKENKGPVDQWVGSISTMVFLPEVLFEIMMLYNWFLNKYILRPMGNNA